MLFYNFNTLDDFIKHDLVPNVKEELKNLDNIVQVYEKKASTQPESQLKQLNSIISLAQKLIANLNEVISLYEKNVDNNFEEIKANLVEYNKQGSQLFQEILNYENQHLPNSPSVTPAINNAIDIELHPQDNNTLIISEKDQKAYLPFYYFEIEKIFNAPNNKYKCKQDIVNDLYVLPLSRFKYSSISRFRESFNLITKKEHSSITKAIDLGLELMFKYNLNPIIISACRTLEELDIYLDCLENNNLEDFDCFEIKFEVSPQIDFASHKA